MRLKKKHIQCEHSETTRITLSLITTLSKSY